jgi:acetolactate synthase small subunit
LTKSYIVKIKAENEDEAKGCAELFTGDVQDISSPDDRKTFKFQIEDIDCKVNDVFEVMEIQ